MQLSLVLGACIMVGLVGLVSAQCDRFGGGDVDGCSIPLSLPFLYKRKFTPSCNQHDVCYSCVSGSGTGKTKDDCDSKFYDDMMAACAAAGVSNPKTCEQTAKLYYNAVREYGHKHFLHVSSSWCSNVDATCKWMP